MHRAKAWLILALLSPLMAADFSGASALEFTRHAVDFGPRPPGSPALKRLRAYIHEQLRKDGCDVSDDVFRARTTIGPVEMDNIIAHFPGSSGRGIVITGHYDTKLFPGRRFVGANDGGSSTGLLLELASVLPGRLHRDDIYLVWFDGEEAFHDWSDTDGTYGSRQLAAKWASDGMLGRIKALINVDMIGDKDLDILIDQNSSPALRQAVWQAARDIGYGKYFLDQGMPIEDDHLPFAQRGVQVLDLIDFDYGPHNEYWHTDQDTMDKLSGHSLEVVGNVILEYIRRAGTAAPAH
jgi:Zn-dependent M28 family amino/carboxypeptidase